MYPSELSGGEQQRTRSRARSSTIRRSCSATNRRAISIPSNSNEIMELLSRINLKGTTVVVATHNQAVVDRMRRRVVRLEDGRVTADEERGYLLSWTRGKVKFFLGEVLRNFHAQRRHAGDRHRDGRHHHRSSGRVSSSPEPRSPASGAAYSTRSRFPPTCAPTRPARRSPRSRAPIAQDPRIASAQFVPKKKAWPSFATQTKGVIDTRCSPRTLCPISFA